MTDSIWKRTLSAADREVLERSDAPPFSVDILVVGAGLIGLSVAEALATAGAGSIAVIDRDGPAAAASSANAGGLWFAHESSREGVFSELAKLSDRLYAELAEQADVGITRRGILDLLWSDDEVRDASQRAEDLRSAGFQAEMLDGRQAREAEPALGVEPAGALLTPNDGQVHPVRLAAEWTRRLRSRGALVSGGVEALSLGSPVETSRGPISAGTVVVASGAWTPLVTEAVGWRPPIRPIRGALLALPPMAPGTLRHTVMARDYYHWQLAEGPVAGGGSHEDVGFLPGVEESTAGSIRAEMGLLFPSLAEQPTDCAWSGFRPFCEDGLPVVGRAPADAAGAPLYVAAGHFRKGVMLAPATGKLLAETILHGAASTDISALSPARFPASEPWPG